MGWDRTTIGTATALDALGERLEPETFEMKELLAQLAFHPADFLGVVIILVDDTSVSQMALEAIIKEKVKRRWPPRAIGN